MPRQTCLPNQSWMLGLFSTVRSALLTLTILATGMVSLANTNAAQAQKLTFQRVHSHYIAALGDPGASFGTGAETWGLWTRDPGPIGVHISLFDKLMSKGGVGPGQWKFDQNDWWLDENGLLMEKPVFPLPPGKYLVTGDRETVSILVVHPKTDEGVQYWELANGATLYDVTHLPCRSGRYSPVEENGICTPKSASPANFPVEPGGIMPTVEGCQKTDYTVLFVIGIEMSNWYPKE